MSVHTHSEFQDFWFSTQDGLSLYARDYPNNRATQTVICIPGLTRNSADFADLCTLLSSQFRVLAVELRGRGKSNYDPKPENYLPATYANDIVKLLDDLDLQSVILIGTSLGGLVSMIASAMRPNRIDKIILNDIGPEINTEGLERIKEYVCDPETVTTWSQAIEKTRSILKREYPKFSERDWEAFTRNLYREDNDGRPVLNYDPAIAVPMKNVASSDVTGDLWPVFDLIKHLPILVFRGCHSDILSTECVRKMRSKKSDIKTVEITDCGHAPLLTEAEAITAITQFLNLYTNSEK